MSVQAILINRKNVWKTLISLIIYFWYNIIEPYTFSFNLIIFHHNKKITIIPMDPNFFIIYENILCLYQNIKYLK